MCLSFPPLDLDEYSTYHEYDTYLTSTTVIAANKGGIKHE